MWQWAKAFLFFLFWACAKTPEQPKQGPPTSENDWVQQWDKKSWNISVLEGYSPEAVLAEVNLGFTSVGFSLKGNAQKSRFINRKIRKNYLFSLKETQEGVQVQPRVQGYYFASIPVYGESEQEVLENFQLIQKQLEAHPGFLYAEPSLKTKPKFSQAHTEDVQNYEHFKTIRLPESIEFLTKNVALPDREIVVAVLDSGVDFANKYIKARLWKHPGELETPNGIDDDGNGYIDDIYGVDTTRTGGDPNFPLEPFIQGQSQGVELYGEGESCPPPSLDPSCGHGTHVSGIIVADPSQSEAGISSETPFGLCANCRVFSMRVMDRVCVDDSPLENCEFNDIVSGEIKDDSQIEALTYIENLGFEMQQIPFHIINLSIGKYFPNRNIEQLVSSLSQQGVLIVAAASNDDTSLRSYPAAYPSVLSVCATEVGAERGQYLDSPPRGVFAKADYSNFGVWVDLCAPGTQIPSAWPGNHSTQAVDGTSQATPIVSAAAGVVWAYLSKINPNEIITGQDIKKRLLIYANGDALYNNTRNTLYSGTYSTGHAYYLLGSGALDLYNALAAEVVSGRSRDGESVGVFSSRTGCVVSSVNGPIPYGQLPLQYPFILLLLALVLYLRHKWRS